MLRPHRHPHPLHFASRVGVAVVLCLGGTGCHEPDSDVTTPERNVLLVTLSGTRADRLGCYGFERATTPYLDGLALEGIRFEQAFATSGLTPVSQAAIHTGRNNPGHGLRVVSGELNHRLAGGVPSLPQILGNRGWRTAGFVSSYLAGDAFGLGRGYQQFRSSGRNAPSHPADAGESATTPQAPDARESRSQRRSDATTDDALTWLEEHAEQGPWHLWVQYADVHDLTLVPPKEFALPLEPEYAWLLDTPSLESREKLYDLEIGYTDAQFGRLIEYLRNTGQYENTVIVVVGDHGQGLTEGESNHGWSHNGLLYNWSLHVPLIVKLPEFPPGVVLPNLVRTIDVLPTILEQVKLPSVAKLGGRSLLPIVRGQLDEPRTLFADALVLQANSELSGRYPARFQDNLFLVQNDRWKFIHHELEPANSELYDRLGDPHETNNLYSEEPEVAARLLRVLREREGFARKPLDPAAKRPDPQRLRDLGYGVSKN